MTVSFSGSISAYPERHSGTASPSGTLTSAENVSRSGGAASISRISCPVTRRSHTLSPGCAFSYAAACSRSQAVAPGSSPAFHTVISRRSAFRAPGGRREIGRSIWF